MTIALRILQRYAIFTRKSTLIPEEIEAFVEKTNELAQECHDACLFVSNQIGLGTNATTWVFKDWSTLTLDTDKQKWEAKKEEE